MTYTPTKGSPRPTVPGANPVEVVLSAAENLAGMLPSLPIPVVQQIENSVNLVLSAAQAAVSAIDPSGMKAVDRTKELTQAEAQTHSTDPLIVQIGIQRAVVFATDKPAHPTAWVHWARWIPVQVDAPDPFPDGP